MKQISIIPESAKRRTIQAPGLPPHEIIYIDAGTADDLFDVIYAPQQLIGDTQPQLALAKIIQDLATAMQAFGYNAQPAAQAATTARLIYDSYPRLTFWDMHNALRVYTMGALDKVDLTAYYDKPLSPQQIMQLLRAYVIKRERLTARYRRAAIRAAEDTKQIAPPPAREADPEHKPLPNTAVNYQTSERIKRLKERLSI